MLLMPREFCWFVVTTVPAKLTMRAVKFPEKEREITNVVQLNVA